MDHGRTPDDAELILFNESDITLYVGDTYVETGAICEDWNWRYPVWINESPTLDTNLAGEYVLTYRCGTLQKNKTITVKYHECLTGPLTCSNGRIVYPDKTNNCEYNCHDYLHECTFERFAGPDCQCSPNWEGCVGFGGNVRATWDGENCGCEVI